jgi:hypothetical protein
MRISLVMMLLSSVLALAGCSSMPEMTTTSTATNQAQGVTLHGRVHGGNNPITGASVYLYAVGTGGYSAVSDPLLKNPVTTDSNGNFSITGDYSCPSMNPQAQVYIYAVGGNPGLASGTNNTAAGLLAGLGSCTTLLADGASFPPIFVNEVSTVATAYSLAGFATDPVHMSSSSNPLAVTDVGNAFGTIPNLETLSTGVARTQTQSGAGTVPQTTINTLANILAACINTTGSTAAGQPCNALFTSAIPGWTTGTQADTASAAINIAHHPGANVSALLNLQGSNPPFVPDLPASPAPNDFTIGIYWSGQPGWGPYTGEAVDAEGNVWLTGGYSTTSSPLCALGELLANGTWSANTPITGGGISAWCPAGLAIDSSTNLWITASVNESTAALIELNSSGSVLSPSLSNFCSSCSGFTETNFDEVSVPAVDGSGNIWMTGEVNNQYYGFWEFIPGTGFPTDSPPGGGGLNQPGTPAIDASGDIWASNDGDSTTTELNPGVSITEITGGGQVGGGPIAIDANGNAWIPSPYISPGVLSEYDPTTSSWPSGSSGFTGGGLSQPQSIAIDGASNVWAANAAPGSDSISELSDAGVAISGTNGYTASPNPMSGNTGTYLSGPNAVAVDGSGNVWVLNGGNNYITEVVGAAAPVVTPLAANLASPYSHHAVNEP